MSKVEPGYFIFKELMTFLFLCPRKRPLFLVNVFTCARGSVPYFWWTYLLVRAEASFYFWWTVRDCPTSSGWVKKGRVMQDFSNLFMRGDLWLLAPDFFYWPGWPGWVQNGRVKHFKTLNVFMTLGAWLHFSRWSRKKSWIFQPGYMWIHPATTLLPFYIKYSGIGLVI